MPPRLKPAPAAAAASADACPVILLIAEKLATAGRTGQVRYVPDITVSVQAAPDLERVLALLRG